MIRDTTETVECSKHFSRDELKCSFSPDAPVLMDSLFMAALEELRSDWGQPMYLSSAFRTTDNPRERTKPRRYDHNGDPLPIGGYHARGRAVDVLIAGSDAVAFLRLALKYFSGVGLSQKDKNWSNRFIHLDDGKQRIWTY